MEENQEGEHIFVYARERQLMHIPCLEGILNIQSFI